MGDRDYRLPSRQEDFDAITFREAVKDPYWHMKYDSHIEENELVILYREERLAHYNSYIEFRFPTITFCPTCWAHLPDPEEYLCAGLFNPKPNTIESGCVFCAGQPKKYLTELKKFYGSYLINPLDL